MTGLDDLEKKAKAATPGPWSAVRNGNEQPWYRVHVGDRHGPALATPDRRQDAEYIAAASPDVVLDLVASLREALDLAAEFRAFHDGHCATGCEYDGPLVERLASVLLRCGLPLVKP